VTGRWSYASGARHATWFTANSVVHDGSGRPRTGPDGLPLIRAIAVPAGEVVVHDAWAVAGLRGTGSEDFEIADRFVPRERSFSVAETPRETGLLYRFPFFSIAELSFAAVSLGIARLALDEFRALARNKRPAGSAGKLCEDADVQSRYARAEAAVRASRALTYSAAEDAWAEIVREGELSAPRRADVRLAAVDTVRRCAGAIDLLYERAGMSPLFTASAFGRAWRDAHAVTQNMAVSSGLYVDVGEVLLRDAGPAH
jgi:alkylation response protein AidB-like acyl-CoA dehydrogenase